MVLRSDIFTAIISIGLGLGFSVCIGDIFLKYITGNLKNLIFLIGHYAAELLTNENLRNSTVRFHTSLVPGASVTWYSNFLSILFCVHLASFCVRFIGAQCAAKRICCTTTRLCARCTLSAAGISTMLVLHLCYGHTSLGFW